MNRRERRKQAKKAKGQSSGDPAALFNAAVDDLNEGNFAQAEQAFRHILGRWPSYAEAMDLLGVVYAKTGRLQDAAAIMANAVELKPDAAGFHNNLGNVLSSLGRRAEAVQAYERALALRPDDPQTLNNLGSTLYAMARLDAAAEAYERALKLRPEYPEALSNYGNVLIDQGRIADAVAANQKALALNPAYPVAHNNLGNGLRRLGRYEDAVQAYIRALELKPLYADALCNLAETLKEQGRALEALPFYEKALAVDPRQAGIHSNLLLALNSVESLSRMAVYAEHKRWGERFAAAPPAHAKAKDPDKRLRVGYVSPDFRKHSVAYFIEPVIAAHDRNAVEVFCYANVAVADAVTARIKDSADGWRDIRGLTDADAAAKIRADGIDILVDLAGHTMDGRLPLFALKPAPVQVTYLGYPNTTGLAAVDYRLTDAVADPEGEADRYHTERLIRLANGFLCYRPPADAPDVAPPPFLANGFVTFGSCNNLSKIGPATVAAWAAILKRVPEAWLFLKAKPLADEGTRRRLAGRFAEHGIDPDRLVMTGWIVDGNHLAVYKRIDVGLDTFPYNGTTTTCEALWMGVSVVTLAGDRHAARVGASLLTRAGLDDLIAQSPEVYVERAVALAGDPARLGALRAGLRDTVARSALSDAQGFTRTLEAAYRHMWRAWCGQPA
jgi:predicted O-linked N-acetylglucosamine transferase (SPINDLY family)